MTHRSVMPDYAAAILRSTCEAATTAIAERGRLDDHEIRSFIGGVADCFDADPSGVTLDELTGRALLETALDAYQATMPISDAEHDRALATILGADGATATTPEGAAKLLAAAIRHAHTFIRSTG